MEKVDIMEVIRSFGEEAIQLYKREMDRLKKENEMYKEQKIGILNDRDHYAHKLQETESELNLVKDDLDRLRKRVAQTKENE